MELSLVGNDKTRIKVSVKELERDEWLRSILGGALKPYKESSRYKYFIVDGDLLNKRKGD